MSLQKNLLTKTFEALLNAATQTPTDEVMNRDGINLMLQGFELIMQAHGFTYVDTTTSLEEKPAVVRSESDQAILVEIRDLLRRIMLVSHPSVIVESHADRDPSSEQYLRRLRERGVIREEDMKA